MITILELINAMSPFLLLGFFLAGIMHAFVPNTLYSRYLAKDNFASIFWATLFGIPLPLCSCGVIPTAMSLRREGASKGATVSFLIATPQTGVDSIIATYSLMGLPFAIVRPVAALLTALFGGTLVNIFRNKHEEVVNIETKVKPQTKEKVSFARKFISALKYGYVIAIGLPFSMIGTTLNSIIRSDGSPKYSMTTMLVGAVLNTILDPIFIFVFKMGVEGAAIATVISQILVFILNALYVKKFKSIKLSKESFKVKSSVAKKVSMLGISSFINQMSIVFVMATENNTLGKYGAESKFGAEIPITVLGIVMKISQILNSIIIGIAAGAQPIFGYNYGARKFDRVKTTLKIVLGSSLVISTIAFILFKNVLL